MKEKIGNLWENHPDNIVIITTNGYIRSDGSIAMGKGCAKEASLKYPYLPSELGALVLKHGNIPIYFPKYKIYTFPTKHNWWELSRLDLILSSMKILHTAVVNMVDAKFNMPRPGCGYGGLKWETIKPEIEEYLDDRFTVYGYDK